MKERIILGSLIVLILILFIPNVSAAYECSTPSCHQEYYNAINAKQHSGSDGCVYCHPQSSYYPTHTGYVGYIVNETNTCNQAPCHSNTSGSRPIYERHSSSSDCTTCHFANTTQKFRWNNSLYTHDHNFTVEYNFYNYNISGIPLKSNNGVGKGLFPYYTCTLTCHADDHGVDTQKIDEAASSWLNSSHAKSLHMSGDNNNSCAKCKSPPNYNVSASGGKAIAQADWQGIQCRVCHNLHDRKFPYNTGQSGFPIAFYNSTKSSQNGYATYEKLTNATQLCENCHSGTSHDSKFAGTHRDTVGFDCTNCHMNSTFNNELHLFEVKNTTSGVEGCEVCHDSADHTFKFTSLHENEVTCEACHDKTVARNSSGYVVNVSSGMAAGLYKDPSTNKWSTYKVSHGSPATWPLHNISLSVDCNKCHGALSVFNGTIAPTFGSSAGCDACHSSYVSAVNSTTHNQTLTMGAPGCTYCHSGYEPIDNHTSGNRRFVVNESNTCRNCHVQNLSGFYERHTSSSDCTQCHFANTTQIFNVTASSYTHDHNLTIERNFYQYNLSGMPVRTNGGLGAGMFPYYTCTLTCHKYNATTGVEGKIDEAAKSWFNSSHARSLHMSGDNTNSCAKCKSPPNYNVSASSGKAIAQADWQGIQCRVCHNLHDRKFPNNTGPSGFPIAFYNSTKSSQNGYATYDQLTSATKLCENCHYGSSHDSKYAGYHRDTLGFDCTNCHMNSTFNTELHLFEVKNTTSGVEGCEVCHDSTSVHSGIFSEYFVHKNIVTCEACHDKTVARNSSGYVVNVSSGMATGLYKDTSTNKWSTYKVSHNLPATWPLHNISKSIDCNKCHGALSVYNGSIAPELSGETGCAQCHPTYVNAVNSSMHNQTKNPSAPACIGCHNGYDVIHSGKIVNESNTCRNSGCHQTKDEKHRTSGADCTQCHFANTTKSFSLNATLYVTDHNLSIIRNFYQYNLSGSGDPVAGMPLTNNHGVGLGMFPYYSCTMASCHSHSNLKIENTSQTWVTSNHAQSLRYPASADNKNNCALCKSPLNYNISLKTPNPIIAAADWQGVTCRVCHNLHNRSFSPGAGPIAFYNATQSSTVGYVVYDQVSNATELCEKCHNGGSHDSKYAGTHKDTLNFTCVTCHMSTTTNSFNFQNHMFEVKNTTSGVTGCEVCHNPSNHTWQFTSNHENIVTCEACHDKTVARNSSDFVVNISVGMDAGLYKDTSTNKWTTYKVSHGTPASWPLHNISKTIDCNKCHGARSVYSGAIAPNLTSGGTTYYTTDTLISGYKFILVLLYPQPTIYANYLINSSLSGVSGVNKTLNWNSTAQKWEGYEYINGVYFGTNFTVAGYTSYMVKGNNLSVGKAYTLKGRK